MKSGLRHMVLFLLLGLLATVSRAQEFPYALNYVDNMFTINPAYVGMWEKVSITSMSRKNWISIQGTPFFQTFSYNSPVKNENNGIGINLQSYTIGHERRFSITGDYAYNMRVSRTAYLRMGLRVGFMNYRNNLLDYILFPDRVPDSEFMTDVNLKYMATWGVGALLFDRDYYISLSVPKIINNSLSVTVNKYSSLPEIRNFYLAGGYVFHLVHNVKFKPAGLITFASGEVPYFDGSATVILPNDLSVGILLRSNGVTCLNASYKLRNLRFGFASEYALFSDIKKYQLGTYEFYINYEFNFYKRKYVRPVYF